MGNLFGKTVTNDEFLNAFGEACVKRYAESQILPSLPVCQAILESGWGTSAISTSLYNYHGLNYYGDSVTIGVDHEDRTTKQWSEEKGYYSVVNTFCKFKTMDEELNVLYKWYNRNKPAYKALHGNTDALQNFKLIKEAGYATSPTYTESLTRIYNMYPAIKALDEQVLKSSNTSSGKVTYYRVQVGAFSSLVNANNYVKKLKDENGLEAFLEYGDDGLYRVFCGSYQVLENATKQLETLTAQGLKAFIKETQLDK